MHMLGKRKHLIWTLNSQLSCEECCTFFYTKSSGSSCSRVFTWFSSNWHQRQFSQRLFFADQGIGFTLCHRWQKTCSSVAFKTKPFNVDVFFFPSWPLLFKCDLVVFNVPSTSRSFSQPVIFIQTAAVVDACTKSMNSFCFACEELEFLFNYCLKFKLLRLLFSSSIWLKLVGSEPFHVAVLKLCN